MVLWRSTSDQSYPIPVSYPVNLRNSLFLSTGAWKRAGRSGHSNLLPFSRLPFLILVFCYFPPYSLLPSFCHSTLSSYGFYFLFPCFLCPRTNILFIVYSIYNFRVCFSQVVFLFCFACREEKRGRGRERESNRQIEYQKDRQMERKSCYIKEK